MGQKIRAMEKDFTIAAQALEQPERLRGLIADLRQLDADQLTIVATVVNGLLQKK